MKHCAEPLNQRNYVKYVHVDQENNWSLEHMTFSNFELLFSARGWAEIFLIRAYHALVGDQIIYISPGRNKVAIFNLSFFLSFFF